MQNSEHTFLVQLLQEGRVVMTDGGIGPERGVRQTLIDFEISYRQHLAAVPPPLDADAAAWAATLVYDALLCLVDRSRDEQQVQETFTRPCPVPLSASVVYSVDLTLRFLPDVARLAHAAAERDPLNEHLARIATDWPLSSVGMSGVPIPSDHPVLCEMILLDDCLRMLYVDRIIARRDAGRLQHPDVRASVRAACHDGHLLPTELAEAVRIEPPAGAGVLPTKPLTTPEDV